MFEKAPMKLSVIVCTHNRAHLMPDLLNDLRGLVPPEGHGVEVLFVDNASSDDTYQLLVNAAKSLPFPMSVIKESSLGISFARNRGALEACGDYVVFLDDDARPDPKWLQAYARGFEEWQPDVAGGPIVPYGDRPLPRWLDEPSGLHGPYLAHFDRGPQTCWLEGSGTVWGGNMAFHRKTLLAVGGFDTALGPRGHATRAATEDAEVQLRIIGRGGRVLYVHDAQVRHLISPERLRLGYFLRTRYERGISNNRVWGRIRWWRGLWQVGLEMVLFLACLLVGRLAVSAWHLGKAAWSFGRLVDTLFGKSYVPPPPPPRTAGLETTLHAGDLDDSGRPQQVSAIQ